MRKTLLSISSLAALLVSSAAFAGATYQCSPSKDNSNQITFEVKTTKAKVTLTTRA